MSKKSFEDLVNLLKKENYNFKFFQAESTGNFLPEDSNWNYKDVVHARFVHPGLNNVQACALGDVTSSINLLKLPFLGLSIPLVCVMYEQSRFKLVYFSSFGPYIIVNNTNSERIDSKKTKVTLKEIEPETVHKPSRNQLEEVIKLNIKDHHKMIQKWSEKRTRNLEK